MIPFQRTLLPNGLTFLYRQSPGVPLAAATLLFRTGSCDETPREAGLASLSLELMLQGTRRRTSRQLADTIESMGASLGLQASEDYSELGFVAPVTGLNKILDVMADMLTAPTFPLNEINKERVHVLAALKSRRDSIFNFSYDIFNQRFYGEHPYGRPVDGAESTVKRFTRNDVVSWYKNHVHPNRAILSMVSSLSWREARERVSHYLKGWKKTGTGVSLTPPVIPPGRAHAEKLRARFEQAYLMTGVLAPAAAGSDTTFLKVLNTLLGGGMSSRLFLRLREELGLAYEVSAFFPTRVGPSQWVFYMGLPVEKLPLAKRELEKILRELENEMPRRSEVDQAIAMIKGSYLMEHQTRRRQAWYAAWWEFLGRSPTYDKQFIKAVESVTPAQLRTLARKLLSQPRITVEVVPK